MNHDAERIAVVIEDDADVQEVIATILVDAGFVVRLARNGLEGIEMVSLCRPTLTTLDVSMSGMDGFETLKRIRAISATRVIMISARFDEIDIVRGLAAGADDFLSKPFRIGELRARIDAVLRRSSDFADAAPPAAPAAPAVTGWFERGRLRIDAERRLVEVDRAPVLLTRSEFDLLASLVTPYGSVRTKAELILDIRGDAYATSGVVSGSDRRSLEVHVANLRKKVGRTSGGDDLIETVRGVGYRMASIESDQPA